MSFASDAKIELGKLKIDDCCKMAELSALLQLTGEITINSEGTHIKFNSMNNTTARAFISLIKDLYDLPCNIIVKEHHLTKNDVFEITVDNASKLISDFELFNRDYSHHMKYIKKECCKKAYLRGAFLASGSVNDPKKSYHLEIKCRKEETAIFIQMLMNSFRLNSRISKRREELIVYVKESQAIADFMYLIGASKTYFQFEDVRVSKDFNNMINRKNNCDLANTVKSVNAANEQLKDIDILYSAYDRIDEKLFEVCEIRRKNPTASLNELLDLYKEEYDKEITKSCLNHRFRKIHELASEPEKK